MLCDSDSSPAHSDSGFFSSTNELSLQMQPARSMEPWSNSLLFTTFGWLPEAAWFFSVIYWLDFPCSCSHWERSWNGSVSGNPYSFVPALQPCAPPCSPIVFTRLAGCSGAVSPWFPWWLYSPQSKKSHRCSSPNTSSQVLRFIHGFNTSTSNS